MNTRLTGESEREAVFIQEETGGFMKFIDLGAQQAQIKERVDARIQSVLAGGAYIMGPEVKELEQRLADFCGAKHCVTCANGTDALLLSLMALGVSAGDAVFVPSFTFAATAEIVPFVNAVPFFVDVDSRTYNMDPESLKRSIAHAKEAGLHPSVVIPVDLFGLPANYEAIGEIAKENGMALLGDSAQGFGGTINGHMTGTMADITTTSFFPAKPLGCYGDGGAVFTDSDEWAMLLDSYRVHGKGTEKYDNVRLGTNSRLDTLQAAILLEKLAIYSDELVARQAVADRYSAALADHFTIPHIPEGYTSVWAQYTLRTTSTENRNQVMENARAVGVPTVIYYPKPLHEQTAYRDFPQDPQDLSVSEVLSKTVFSLPMHPYLKDEDISSIVDACLR